LLNTATMRISADNDVIFSEIDIAAPPEQVFRALVDPAQVLQWWGQPGVYQCKEFQADVRAGGHWRCAGIGPDGRGFEITGEYLEVDPPRLLVHSWVASWTGDAKTTVSWELQPTASGTSLHLRHSGLAVYPGIGESYRGWPRMLGWIKALLETGETVQARKAS
jgi:uncharacterized protein YndB with AHSA1/START domain